MKQSQLFRLFGLIYSSTFSAIISIVTLLFVDAAVGIIVVIWRLLQINRRLLATFCSAILRIWFSIFMGHLEHFGRLTVVLTGDSFYPNEPALVVCNHRSWLDTIILYSLARQVRMHGDVKFLAKRSLLIFPIFGFAGWVLDVVIFIKRQSSSAGRRMGKMFSSLTDPRRDCLPYWLINYLEGTRFTMKKRREALTFAEERGLKQLHHVLQPRTKGFIATVRALRGNARAVYDVTIGYDETEDHEMSPSFREMCFTPSLTNRIVHVHQRRIPLSEIPEDEDELRRWVYTLYEQKDELIQGFRENGSFAGRPMRWNRMTLLYWVRCQIIIYSSFAILAYFLYRLLLTR